MHLMTADFTVVTVGTDSSDRPIKMTRYMRDWWEETVEDLGFRPVIVQGAFVAGVGAAASAGYHDKGGCIDLRVWDLDDDEQAKVIRVTRRRGAASWVRDAKHGGFDPHIHLLLGTDEPLAAGAKAQWADYVKGGNGLTGASAGKDYHWRPDPLVLVPPKPRATPRWDNIWELAKAVAASDAQTPAARKAAAQIRMLAEPYSTKH